MEDAEWQRHSLDDGPSVESEEAELEPRWIKREFEAGARKFGVAIFEFVKTLKKHRLLG